MWRDEGRLTRRARKGQAGLQAEGVLKPSESSHAPHTKTSLTVPEPVPSPLAVTNDDVSAAKKEFGFDLFLPFPKQREVQESCAQERWDFSGNRKGKTTQFILEDLWHATGDYPDWYHNNSRGEHPHCRTQALPNNGRICATNEEDGLHKVLIPLLQEWVPKRYLLNRSWYESFDARHSILLLKHVRNVYEDDPNPEDLSTIDLMSFQQDPQAFAGPARHWIHQDEHGSKAHYDENKARLVSTNGRFWSALTPIDPDGMPSMSWEYESIFEFFEERKLDPGFIKQLAVFRGSIYDNPTNTLVAVEHMLRGLDDVAKKVRQFGDFVELQGRIYREFQDRIYIPVLSESEFYERSGHIIDPFPIPDHWPRFMAIDPHPQIPIFSLWVACAPDGTHYYYDEFWPDVEGMLVSDYFDLLKIKEGDSKSYRKIHYRLIDSSAKENDPLLGTNIKDEFDRMFRAYDGVTTRIANKNVNAGINCVKSGLKPVRRSDGTWRPKILLFKTLTETRWQFRHYLWDTFAASRTLERRDPKQRPKKKRDHGLDLLRYLELSGLAFEPPAITHMVRGNPYIRSNR